MIKTVFPLCKYTYMVVTWPPYQSSIAFGPARYNYQIAEQSVKIFLSRTTHALCIHYYGASDYKLFLKLHRNKRKGRVHSQPVHTYLQINFAIYSHVHLFHVCDLKIAIFLVGRVSRYFLCFYEKLLNRCLAHVYLHNCCNPPSNLSQWFSNGESRPGVDWIVWQVLSRQELRT